MYLNKNIAENIAHDMTKSIRDSIELKTKKLSESFIEYYYNSLPKDERELLLKLDSSWLTHRNRIEINYYGSERITLYLLKEIAFKPNSYGVTFAEKETFDKFCNLKKEIVELERSEKRLKNEISNVVLKSRTAEKLKVSFPEAYSKLPKESISTGNFPAIPVSRILEEINTLSA